MAPVNDKTMKKILFILLSAFLFCCVSHAQQIDKITRRCPNTNIYGTALVTNVGDITVVPCSGRATIFTGNVNLSGATVTGVVTGTGTNNFIPMWTNGASGVLGDTPLSWNGTLYNAQNTAKNNTFVWNFTPSSTTGALRVGEDASALFTLDQASKGASLCIDNFNDCLTFTQASGKAQLNGITTTIIGNNASSLRIQGTDVLQTTLQTFDLSDAAGAGFGVNTFNFLRTVTTAGTTGNQTINKPVGSVNFAAGASNITVTNSTVTANSLIFVMPQRADGTCSVFQVDQVTGGSFHINSPLGNCTAETRVAFIVTN